MSGEACHDFYFNKLEAVHMAGIKEMLSKGVTSVNVKTSNFMEINKIKTYINTLNDEILDLQKIIGRKTYEAWKNESFDVSMIEQELQKIKMNYVEIENQEIKIKEIEEEAERILGVNNQSSDMTGKIFCSSCGRVNNEDSKFCVGCGAQLK